MEIKINREIRNYTESVFFGLSLRQCVFSVLAMAVAVGGSLARRVLIPVNLCDNLIVGVADQSMGKLVQSAVAAVAALEHPV